MSDETTISAEEIMRQIERQMRGQQAGDDEPWLPGLDPGLRDHLLRLQELAGRFGLEPAVLPSSVPLVGRLITWGRGQIHQLVLFYVNGLIRQQLAFQQGVTRSLVYLAEHLEAENKALLAEVEDLRRKLDRLHAPDDGAD